MGRMGGDRLRQPRAGLLSAMALASLCALTHAQSIVSKFNRFVPVTSPLGRANSIAMTNSTTVIFSGGRAGTTPVDSVPGDLLFDANTLTLKQTTGVSLQTTQSAVCQVPEHLLSSIPGGFSGFSFGGLDANGVETNALYAFSPSSGWSLYSTATGTPPLARRGGTCTVLTSCPGSAICLVTFGGTSSKYTATQADSTWTLSLSSAPFKWTLIATSGPIPPAGLYGHTAAATYGLDSMIVFGGYSPATSAVSSDTFGLAPLGYSDSAAKATEMTNLARGMPTAASSQYAQFSTYPVGNLTGAATAVSGSVVDGGTTQSYGTGVNTCFVSYYNTTTSVTGTTNPWWRVDLGSAKSISQLRVWMRTDALTIMNAGIQFWVSNTTSPLPFQLGSGAVNFPNPFPDPIYSPNILTTTTPIVGRYVWALQQGSNKVVQVCEIQVLAPVAWFWRQLSGQVNLALNKFASSSAVVSGFSYGDPLNVNDGNFATVVRTPNPISQPWVIVDLGATYKINQLTIQDGAGANWARNNGTEVVFGDSADPFSATNQQCYGPAPITCFYYSRAPVGTGLAKGFGADGYYNSKYCTTDGNTISATLGVITLPACTGVGRYIIMRKKDSFAASPNGMWYPGFPIVDQCKFSQTAANIAAIAACNKGCPVQPPPFSGCGGCQVLNSTFCTTSPYGQWGGQGLSDAQMLVIAEVAAYGNLQRYSPVGRVGASSAVYGSRMVVFGGQDGNGFLLNDVAMFDTVTMSWEAPQTPLGTPPPGRAYAGMILLPSGIAGNYLTDGTRPPSNSLLIFGGTGPASTFNDVATLSFTQCPTLASGANAAGLATLTCYASGTVCSYSCSSGFVPANPSASATCNPDGTWEAIQPLCGPDPAGTGLLPGAPTLSTPVINKVSAMTSLNFTLSPSGMMGYGVGGPTKFAITTASEYWMQRFTGAPLDTSVWTVGALPPSSTVNNQYAINGQTGYLTLGTSPAGMCKVNQQDCQIVHRAFPTGENLPPLSGAWTVEAQVSFDYSTVNSPVTGNQIGLGIFNTDTPVNVTNPLNASQTIRIFGGLHAFTGMKVTATTTNAGGYESVNSATPLSFYNGATQILSNGITGTAIGWFRIDRWPDELVQAGKNTTRPGQGSWRFGSRFNPLWPWSWSSWYPDSSVLRPDINGNYIFNPNTARIALVGVASSTSARSWGRVHYVRFGQLSADPPGPLLWVNANQGSPLTPLAVPTDMVYTPGSTLKFKAAAIGMLGQGAFSSPTAMVSIPYDPTLAKNWDASRWIEVAFGKFAAGVDSGGVLPTGGTTASNYNAAKGVDGVINVPLVTSVPGFVNYASHTQGSWWYVDLLIPTAVKEVALYNRYDAAWSNLDSFHILLSDDLYTGAANPTNGGPPVGLNMCDPSQTPSSIPFSSTYNGYNAAARFNCSWPTGLIGRYLWVMNGAGLQLSFREIQVYASNSCPARTATQATQVPGSACGAGSPYGSVCAHTCNAGFYAVSGEPTSTCNGDSWNDPPLVCAPQCPLLPAPAYASTCAQTIYAEDFSAPSKVTSSWVSMMETAPTLGPSAFAVNGALQINSGLGVAPVGTVILTTNSDVNDWPGAFTVTADIYTDDSAGLAWRAQSAQNFYRFHIDVVSQVHYVERMYKGNSFLLTTISDFAYIPPNTWVTVSVQVDDSGTFTIYINNNLLASTSDVTFSTGGIGVSASSFAQFENFKYTIACANCQNAKGGSKCAFTCAPGLVAVGLADTPGGDTGTRTCVTAGNGLTASWSPAPQVNGGTDMVCTLNAPYFPSAVLSVPALSPVNTLVGSPLVATITSPDYTVLYAITGGVNASTFYIDSCSGQIKVRSATLDYEVQRVYAVNVTASVADFPLSTTTSTILINVLEVDIAPVAFPTTFNLPENPNGGILVGNIPYKDSNRDNVTFSLEVDGAAGRFVVRPDGSVVVAAGLAQDSINFEQAGSWPYRLTVRITETSAMRQPITASNPALSSTTTVLINLLDVDDAPVITPSLILWAGEAALGTVSSAIGISVTASDQDNTAGGNFTSPLRYSLLPVNNNQSSCKAMLTTRPPYSYPTVDGTITGATLFSIDTNTGALSTTASTPNPALSTNTAFPPFGYAGIPTRIIYVLCVNISEASGVAGAWSVGPAMVAVQADVTLLPVISAVASPAGGAFPTTGGTITLTGSNLGLAGVRTTVVRAVDASGSGRTLNLTACAAIDNGTITCTMPPGSGSLYNLVVYQALTGNPALLTQASMAVQLQVSYLPPTVTSVVVTGGFLKTATGGNLTLIGANLSPQDAADGVSLILGQGAQPFTANTITCALKPSATPHTVVTCVMPPFHSAGWGWTLSIGGQTLNNLPSQSVSYELPVITAVTPAAGTCPGAGCVAGTFALNGLNTLGGDILKITGSGFGPSDTAPALLGTYGGLSFTSCKHEATGFGAGPSSTVYCVTAAGVGKNLGVVITVGNQNTVAFGAATIAYAPPVLMAATLSAPMPTIGGSIISITGSGFGPAGYILGNQVSQFTYGPVGDTGRYTVPGSSCSIIDQNHATCTSVAGVGTGLGAVIVIGNQASTPLNTAGLAYAAPSVFSFSGAGAVDADTVGSQAVTITGNNFGPGDAYTNSLLRVTYGTKLNTGIRNLTQLTFVAAACTIASAGHTSMDCYTVPGAGRALSWQVVVAGQQSVQPTTNYAAPVISGVALQDSMGSSVGAADVNGGTVALLSGSFFGPNDYSFNGSAAMALIQSVTYGQTGDAYSVPLSQITVVSHSLIRVVLNPGAGRNLGFMVTVADQTSKLSTARFSYLPPVVVRMTPSMASTFSDPRSPTYVTLAVLNLPLRDTLSVISIRFGNGASVATITPVVPVGAAALAAATNMADGSVNVTFQLPRDGAGVELGVSVAITSARSGEIVDQSSLGPASLFSYNDPVISSVVVTRAHFITSSGTGNSSGSSTGGSAVACPFPSSSTQWSCTDPAVVQLTIYGSSFGSCPASGGVCPPAASEADGVGKELALLNYNGTAGSAVEALFGEVWCGIACTQEKYSVALPSPVTLQMLWIQSWSHTTITAYIRQTSALMRLHLLSTTENGVAATQEVMRLFTQASPEVGALTGAVANVPTTGGTSPITISVYNLAPGDTVQVTVGGNQAVLSCSCGGYTGAGAPGSAACVADLITQQLNALAPGSAVSICATIPAGQGSAAAVQVTRINSALDSDVSNVDFTVGYLPPTVDTVKVVENGVVTQTVSGSVYGASITIPTDGSAVVRIQGSSLGTSPTVYMGDYSAAGGPLTGAQECTGTVGTHTCYEIGSAQGEGTGNQWPEYQTGGGYTLTLAAGDQLSGNTIHVVYRAPIVTSITPTNSSLIGTSMALPTSGGVTVNVTGSNFGTRVGLRPDSTLRLVFRSSSDMSADLECTNIVRAAGAMSHRSLTCTLPEGSGRALNAVMTVADVTASSPGVMSYSAPVVSKAYVIANTGSDYLSSLASGSIVSGALSYAPGVDASMAVDRAVVTPGMNGGAAALRANTTGGDWIVLEGANFGSGNPAIHCAYGAWVNRNPSNVFACNGQEDWLGEGEVPSAASLSPSTAPNAILYWSHTLVIFAANPGIGRKEVTLSVRGSTPATGGTVPLTYRAPVILALDPVLVDTDGGTLVTLQGSGFGPAIRDTSNVLNIPVFPLSLADAPKVPTAYLAVALQVACVALNYDADGRAVTSLTVPVPATILATGSGVPLAGCSRGIVSSSRTDSSLTFAMPAGVGARKNITVYVLDGPAQAPLASNTAIYSYKPPKVQAFVPQVVLVSPSVTSTVEVYGDDFGNLDFAASQHWGPAELAIDASVGGTQCSSISRVRGQVYGGGMSTIVTCNFDPTGLACGGQNFSISIAGQTGSVDSWTPPFANTTSINLNSLVIACHPGSYGHIGESCLPCPAQYPDTPALTGASCAGYIDDHNVPFLQRFPYPRPTAGWYNLNSSDANTLKNAAYPGESQMEACPDGFQDGGRDVCIVPCYPASSCLGDNNCAYGYASKSPLWRCSDCADGFYHNAGACVKCPDSPWALVIGFAMLVVAAGILGYMLNQKGVNIAVISIGIDFFQVLAIFATSGVQWPPVIKDLFHILSAFNLNIEIVAPECIVPNLGYKQKFWFIMLLPLCVGALLGMIFLVILFNKAVIKGQQKKDWYSHKPALGASCLALLYILYLYLSRTIMDVFNCTPTMPPDGYLHLAVAGGEKCGVPGGTQMVLMPYAVAGLIIYCFGYPAFIGYTLFKNRELAMLDQLLRAKGTGDDKLSNPHAFNLRQTYGRSYLQFKPDYILWSLAIILRKFCIAITAVVFNRNSSFQMAACLLIMFLAYAAQTMARPYMSVGEFDDVLRHHTESSLHSALHVRLAAQVATIETRGRKKTRRNLLNFSGKIDRSAVLGLLTSWLFNYNTIEQIMLFSAVIVCLMGIMYQANTNNTYYPGALDGVTAVVLITVIAAIIYYFTMLIAEIVILYNEASTAKRLAKQAAASGGAGGKNGKGKGGKGGDLLEGGGKGGKSGGNAGSLVDHDGNLQLGRLETQVNPLFTSSGGTLSNLANPTEAIVASRDPPPPELWRLFQASYAEQTDALKTAHSQILQLQRTLQEGGAGVTTSAGGSAGGSAAEGGMISNLLVRRGKAQFAPSTASGTPGAGSGKAGATTPAKAGSSRKAGNALSLKSMQHTQHHAVDVEDAE